MSTEDKDKTLTPEASTPEAMEKVIERTVTAAFEANRKDQTSKIRTSILDEIQPDISVGDEIVPFYERHAGMYLNAFQRNLRGDREGADKIFNDLSKLRKEMTPTQKRVETNVARDMIQNSRLSREAKRRSLMAIQRNSQVIGTPTLGGNLLPKPFFAEIFLRIEEFGVARSNFRSIPMSSNTIDLKPLLTKPAVFWNGELVPGTETDITIDNMLMTAGKLMAINSWSLEFQEDEVFGYLSLASELFGEAVAKAEDSAGFTGAGAGDTANGEFTGLLNLTGQQEQVISSQDASTIDFDDVSEGYHKLTLAAKQNGKYFANPTFEGVFQRIKDLEGRYQYKMPGDSAGVPTLWGRPVEYVEAMPAIGDLEEGDETPFMVYGDPRHMLLGDRSGLQLDISDQGTIRGEANTVKLSAFQDDAAILRVKERIAFKGDGVPNSFVVFKTAPDAT